VISTSAYGGCSWFWFKAFNLKTIVKAPRLLNSRNMSVFIHIYEYSLAETYMKFSFPTRINFKISHEEYFEGASSFYSAF
jgi:hypothetical protein